MKFAVTVGKHAATIELDPPTGTIVSDEFGTGTISDVTQNGDELTGKVSLDSHTASFEAQLIGKTISGTLRVGWLFSEDFAGTQVEG